MRVNATASKQARQAFFQLRRRRAATKLRRVSLVAQSVEQVTVNHRVGGSSPSQGAILFC